MPSIRQESVLVCVLLALGLSSCQQGPGTSDKQIRLEDIERDNLNSQGQKEQAAAPPNHNYHHPAAAAHQQQLAAYQQQQAYLQQLQQQQQQQQLVQQQIPHPHAVPIQGAPQQILVPQGVPYNSLPVMIIQQPAYVDQLAQYYLQQQLAALQYQPVAHSVQAVPHQFAAHGPIQQIIPQGVPHLVQLVQQVPASQAQQPARAQQNNKPFRPSPPLAPAPPRPQTLVYTQQHYNPYNTIYQQQQQQKFLSGVKSTAAPPLKESQGPQQPTQYANFKSY